METVRPDALGELPPRSRGEGEADGIWCFAVADAHGGLAASCGCGFDAVGLPVAVAAFSPRQVWEFGAAHVLQFLRGVVDEVSGCGLVQAGVPDAVERLGVPLDLAGFVQV